MPPKNVLIFSHGELIGDGMMKLPFIKSLPFAFPDARVTWLAGRHPTIFQTALHDVISPYIHTVLSHTGCGDSIKSVLGQKGPQVLWQTPYDVIIDTERKLLPVLFLKKLNSQKFISAAYRWHFSSAKPANTERPLLLLDRLMLLLEAAAGKKIAPTFGVSIPEKWMDLAAHLLAPYQENPIILLAPGAGGRFKCWPLGSFIALAQQLQAADCTVGFILGPAETEWKETLQQACPQSFFPLQQTSETSVYLTIALAKLAAVNVANDGGVGHILASSDQHTLSMWGPTDPLKSTPHGKRVTVIRAQNFGDHEMGSIPVEHVFHTITDVLQKQSPLLGSTQTQ